MNRRPRRARRSKRGHPTPYRRSDGRWAVSVDLGRRPNGERWRLPVYGRSAEDVLNRIPGARARALGVAGEFDSRTTVAQYAAYWIDEVRPTWDEDGRRTGMKHSSWRGSIPGRSRVLLWRGRGRPGLAVAQNPDGVERTSTRQVGRRRPVARNAAATAAAPVRQKIPVSSAAHPAVVWSDTPRLIST